MRLYLKTIVFLLMYCIFSTCANAQHTIGIVGGPTISNLGGSYIESHSGAELGFSVGVRMDSRVGEKWLFTYSLQWIQKGGSHIQFESETQEYGYMIDYFQIPIKLERLFAFKNPSWTVAPFAGMYWGLELGCNAKFSEEVEFTLACDESTFTGNISKMDWGIPLGVSIDKWFPGGSRFHFEIRYDIGLANTFELADSKDQAALHRGFYLGAIGLIYPLGK